MPQAVARGARGSSARSRSWRASFHGASDFLFLGRGIHYPIALEGALKLKEISYIHAEGYPAGEMKHGPIALIDENLPVVALATGRRTFEKVKSNLQEVKARDGIVIAVTDRDDDELDGVADRVLRVPTALRAPAADRQRRAAAAARLPDRRAPRRRRRPAAQPGEERDGRMTGAVRPG